ncbi:MAG: 4Fe-4S binding protein [Methanimicrococcus sp.]|nr:4Fe-4S binding protein [Methanimicrococcus sp.]
MAKHWFPVFTTSRCSLCGACVYACPDNLLSLKSGAVFLENIELCRPNCFKCAKACQNGAVGILRPPKPCDCCSF